MHNKKRGNKRRILVLLLIIAVFLQNEVFHQSIVAQAEEATDTAWLITSDVTMTEDKEVDALIMQQGTLDLNGFTLTVHGDVLQESGTLTVNGGKLHIEKDYRIQKKNELEEYTSGEGVLVMSMATDEVVVGGDFITASSVSSDGYITNGILEVKGNVTQINAGAEDNLAMTGNAVLKLSGVEKQHIKFDTAGSVASRFANVVITNEQGVEFDSVVYATGNVNDNNCPVTGKELQITTTTFSNKSFTGSVYAKDISGFSQLASVGGDLTLVGGTWMSSVREVGGSLSVGECDVSLSADLKIGKDFSMKSGVLDQRGFSIDVEGNVTFNGTTHRLNGGKLLCAGNLKTEGNTSTLYMSRSEDYILVERDFTINSLINLGYTYGTFELKGNMIEQCEKEGAGFSAGVYHTFIFSGDTYQVVEEKTGEIQFGKVILKNTSAEGVYVPNGFRYRTSLTTNGVKYTTDNLEKTGWTLTQDEEYSGDFYLGDGKLNLNGHTLKITGNLIQSGGSITVAKGSLEVGGDYRIQTEKTENGEKEYALSSGELIMTEEEDRVTIGGSFVSASNYSGTLLNGTMKVQKDFTVLSPYNFMAKENHTLILTGEEQQTVDLGEMTSAQVNNIQFDNSSEKGVVFSHAPKVAGRFGKSATPVSLSAIRIISTTTFEDDEYVGDVIASGTMSMGMLPYVRGDLTINGKVTLTSNLEVDGELIAETGSLSIKNYECRVNGDVKGIDGKIYVNDGKMYCQKDVDGAYISNNAWSYLLIMGDYRARGGDCGFIELKGNFSEVEGEKTFIATLKLSGTAKQTIDFSNNDSEIRRVEFCNTSAEGVYSTKGIHCNDLVTDGANYHTGCNGIAGWTLSEDETYDGNLYLHSDVLDLNGHTLTVNGNLTQINGRINFNGGKLIVNGDFRQETALEIDGEKIEERGWGSIYMNQSEEYFLVKGDYIDNYCSSTGIYYGTLELKGSLIVRKNSYYNNFYMSSDSNIIFSGNQIQMVTCGEMEEKNSRLLGLCGNVHFNNSMDGGIKLVGYGIDVEGKVFSNGKYVDGWLTVELNTEFDRDSFNGNILYRSDCGYIENNEFKVLGNLYVYSGMYCKEKIHITGNLYIDECGYGTYGTFGNGLEVEGDVIAYEHSAIAIHGDSNIKGDLLAAVSIYDSMLIVDGDVSINEGTYSRSENGKLLCKGDLNLLSPETDNYCAFMIINSDIFVQGDVSVSENSYIHLENSTLELKGDYNDEAVTSLYVPYVPHANNFSKIIFSGLLAQKIKMAASTSDNLDFILSNTSVEGIYFDSVTLPAANVENNGGKVQLKGGGTIGWTLEDDMVIEGDFNLSYGELNLNGHTLEVHGDFYAGAGNVNINGGKLLISGDMRLQSYDGENVGFSQARITMEQDKDYICIGGDYILQSKAYDVVMKLGTMEIKGDYLCHPESRSFYYNSTGKNHTLVFSGEGEQHVKYMSDDNNSFDFHNMKITSTSDKQRVIFHNSIYFKGTVSDLQQHARTIVDEERKIQLYCNLSNLEQGYFGTNLSGYYENTEFTNDWHIGGKLELWLYDPLDLNGHHIYAKEFTVYGEQLIPSGGEIHTEGDCSLNRTQLIMQNEEDLLSVGGNFEFKPDEETAVSELSDGIIEIKGDVSITGDTFQPLEKHKTILSGREDEQGKDIVQNVTIESEVSRFGELILKKPLECYKFSPDIMEISHSLSTTVKDEEVPEQVTGVKVTNTALTSVSLSWNPAVDNVGIYQYEVYRDGVKVGTTMSAAYVDRDLIAGKSYTYAVIAIDFCRNRSAISESVTGKTVTDIVAPTKPANLRVNRASGSALVIEWGTSQDNVKVAGYYIYRDNVLLDTVTDALTYTDTTLSDEKGHVYKVRAFDTSGNNSEFSNEITGGIKKPQIVETFPFEGGSFGGKRIYLMAYYEKNGNSKGNKVQFQYSPDDGETWKNINESLLGQQGTEKGYYYSSYYWNVSTLPSGPCKIRTLLYDADNNMTETIVNCTYDTEPPAIPDRVFALSNNGLISLSWLPSISIDTNGYNVYRADENGDYVKIGTKESYTDVVFEDKDVEIGKTYTYKVTAFDFYNNESSYSAETTATVVVDERKPEVCRITTEGKRLRRTAEIQVEAKDNIEVKEILLQYQSNDGWIDIGTKQTENGKATYLFDTTVLTDGMHVLRAVATDTSGNISGEYKQAVTIDNTGISQIVIKDTIFDSDYVTLKWNPINEEDFAYFSIEQLIDDEYVQIGKEYSTLGYCVRNLCENQTYTFRVVGYDDIGNAGIPSKKVVLTTKADTTPPSLLIGQYEEGRYANQITLPIWAYDNQQLSELQIEYSLDKNAWTELTRFMLTGEKSFFTEYNFDISKFPEGSIFFRGVSKDKAGNEFKSPVRELIIDRTAPEAVKNLKAEGRSGYIRISWDKPSDLSDQQYFDIYRKKTGAGSYKKVIYDYAGIAYNDTGVEAGINYSYKVIAKDSAGNESAASDVVTVTCENDIDAPVIYSMSPSNGSTIGGMTNITVYALDNACIDTITLEYKNNSSQENYWNLIKTFPINEQQKVLDAEWDNSDLPGGTYRVRAIAKDCAGNESEIYQVSYILDKEAPESVSLNGTGGGYQNELSWSECTSADFSHYAIFRKTAGKEYAQYETATDTSFVDYEVKPGEQYSYIIYTYDKYGNYSMSNAVSLVPTNMDETPPTAVLADKKTVKAGVEVSFDGSKSSDNIGISKYVWDFGNGETAEGVNPKWIFKSTGTYNVTLTVTDVAGNSDTATCQVKALEATASVLTVNVCDESGVGMNSAQVVVIYGDKKDTYTTDSDGDAAAAYEGGRYEVYAYKQGYQPASSKCTVVAGVNKKVTLCLKEGDAASAELTSTQLTLNEIKDLEVDLADMDNWYARKVKVYYTKGGEAPDKTVVVSKDKPVYWEDSEGNSCGVGMTVVKSDSGEKEILYYWKTEYYLKDMFKVELKILNEMGNEFTITNGKAELKLPPGLSLLGTNQNQSLKTDVEDILGQSTKSIFWYIKGDEPGEYNISATFDGEITPIGVPISLSVEAKYPIIVSNNSIKKETADEGFVDEEKKEQYNVFVSDSKGKVVEGAYVMLSTDGKAASAVTDSLGRAELCVNKYDKRTFQLLVRKDGYQTYVDDNYSANCSLYQDFVTLYKEGEKIPAPDEDEEEPTPGPEGPGPEPTAPPEENPGGGSDDFTFKNDWSIGLPGNVPFIGGSNFTLGLDDQIECVKDGNTYKISIGTRDLLKEGDSSIWTKYKQAIESLKDDEALKKGFAKYLDMHPKTTFSNTMEYRCYGYAEGTFVNGKVVTMKGQMRLVVKGKAEKQWQTAVGPVPIVIKLKLETGVDTKAGLGVDYVNKKLYPTMDIALTLPKISLSGGIGIVKIADVSVYGSVENRLIFAEHNTGKLIGEAGISAKLLYATYKKALLKGEYVYMGPSSKNGGGFRTAALRTLNSTYLNPENYAIQRSKIEEEMEWQGKLNALANEATEANELLSSVSNMAKPKMISLKNGDKVLVYLDEAAERTTGNHTAVYYSYCHENVWSEPQIIEDDGTADFEPQLATDGTNSYVTWMNTKRDDFTADSNVLDVAADCEISMAKLDSATMTWEKAERITNNSYMDMNPKVFVYNGTPYLTWLATDATDILSGKGTNKVMFAKKGEEHWEVKPCAAVTDEEISNLEIGMLNNKISVAYMLDRDGDVTTVYDNELYTTSEDGVTKRITNNAIPEENLKFSALKGTSSLVWYDSEGLKYTTDGNAVETLITSDGTLSSDFSVINGNGKDYLLCSSAEDNGSNLYCYHIGKDFVSKPVKVTSQKGYSKNMCGVEENGLLTVAYRCTVPEILEDDMTETSSLWLIRIPTYHDMGITGIEYDEETIQQGKNWTVNIGLKNNGFADEDGYVVSVRRGNEILAQKKCADVIGIGDSRSLQMDIPIPDDFGVNTKLTFVVTPSSRDNAEDDNIQSIVVGKTNLELLLSQNNVEERTSVNAEIENTSGFATPAKLEIRSVNEEGELLKEYALGTIAAGEKKTITLSPEELERYEKVSNSLCIAVVTDDTELYQSDNTQFLYVEMPKSDEIVETPSDKPTENPSDKPNTDTDSVPDFSPTQPANPSGDEISPQQDKVKLSVPKVTGLKLKKKKKKLIFSWKKQKKVSGYQIVYATNKRFKKGKKKTISKTSYKFSIPKKGKYCYAKVRAYKKQGKGKKYGAWSSVKKLKLKRAK